MKLSDLQKMARQLPPSGSPPSVDQIRNVLTQMGYDPDNLYQELEMESRFADLHRDSSGSGSQMLLHSHPFYEILYCTNSCGAEYLMGSQRYRLQKGDVILVPPGISHRPILPEHMEEPYIRYVLWVSTEFMEGMRQSLPSEQAFCQCCLLRSDSADREALAAHFRAGSQETEGKAPGWESVVIGHAVIILSLLYRMLLRTGPYTRAERPELSDRIVAYIETHLADRITLDEAARQFWVSQSTVTQAFRSRMGVSFYRYVTQRRLIAAKSHIEQGLPLEEVSRAVGFGDYSTFYRAFKKEFGISPRAYQKLQRAEENLLDIFPGR